jgi:uncharacterized protein
MDSNDAHHGTLVGAAPAQGPVCWKDWSVARLLPGTCGINQPRPSLFAWPPDAHLALALALAVPVWVLLGIAVGPSMLAPATTVAWLSFVAVQPLAEELVFRGVLQGQALRLTTIAGQPRRLGPVTLANVWVTAGFVLLHLPAQPLAWALAVVVPSLVLGHLRDRFSSVWPAVGVHMIYNTGFALTAWWAHGWPVAAK